jgi:hypothetical protein
MYTLDVKWAQLKTGCVVKTMIIDCYRCQRTLTDTTET